MDWSHSPHHELSPPLLVLLILDGVLVQRRQLGLILDELGERGREVIENLVVHPTEKQKHPSV